MLVSQPYHDLPNAYDGFQPSEERRTSVSSQRSPSKTSMSASSYSSSSSPTNVSTPPDLAQHYGLDGCGDNGILTLGENVHFSVDSLASCGEHADLGNSGTDSPSSGELFSESPQMNSRKSMNGTYGNFPPSEHYNGSYDHSSSFAQNTTSMVLQPEIFSRESSHDVLQTSTEKPLSSQNLQQSVTPRKSFEHVTDKELRKKLKNRESAQAARDRKKAKMLSLERQIAELLERNRMVETENQELRIRIQRMEAGSLWRMDKQDLNSMPADSPSLPTAYAQQQHHGHVHNGSYIRPEMRGSLYTNQCEFPGYSQRAQQCIQNREGTSDSDQHNTTSYAHLTGDQGTDLNTHGYVQNLWPNDQSFQNGPPYAMAEPNYNSTGGVIGSRRTPAMMHAVQTPHESDSSYSMDTTQQDTSFSQQVTKQSETMYMKIDDDVKNDSLSNCNYTDDHAQKSEEHSHEGWLTLGFESTSDQSDVRDDRPYSTT